jgi:hypothetical protein
MGVKKTDPPPQALRYSTGTCWCGVWVQGGDEGWAAHTKTLHPGQWEKPQHRGPLVRRK